MVVTARGQELTVRARLVGRSDARAAWSSCCAIVCGNSGPQLCLSLPPFTSGGVGYFAYDMVRQFERLPERAKDDLGLPDCVFTFYDRLLAFDHLRHQVHIIAAADVRSESPRKAYDRALADIAAIERKLARGVGRSMCTGPPRRRRRRSRSTSAPRTTGLLRACAPPRNTLPPATSSRSCFRSGWTSNRPPSRSRSIARCGP